MSPTAAESKETALPPGLEEHIYRGPWWKHKGIRSLNFLLVLALITSSTNGYDGSMMNGLQSLDMWRAAFNDPGTSTRGLLNAAQNIGALIGLPFCPYMTDLGGRRAGMLFGSVIMLAGVVMQATSSKIGVFISSRGLIGFGLTFAQNSAPILITELAYPTQRAQMTSLFNSLWYSGSIIAAWTTFGTFRIRNNWSWRIPTILQALPSIAQVLFIWFVPESPRWLVSKGKVDQARKILARYHTEDCDEDHPVVLYEMNEIEISLANERGHATSWSTLFATPGNRKRMRIILGIAFFSQWSGNGLVSYYLFDVLKSIGITSETIQTLYNGILQIFNFAIAVGAAFLCDKVGRRPLFLISTAGMLGSWAIWTLCEGLYAKDNNNKSAGYAILAFIFIYYFFYDIAYSPLLVAYTVEITPTPIRAKTLALMNFFVSCSLVFNQYVNPIALEKLGWKYYLVYLAWIAFELVFIYFFLIETKYRTLEETAVIFDGIEATHEITQAGVAAVERPYGGKRDSSNDVLEKDGMGAIEKHEHSGLEHVERV